MSKTTMQDIADALEISRVTVWKTFNNYAGVSEELKKQIIDKAIEMKYSKALTAEPKIESAKTSHTVSVVISRPESALFWTNIIHQLAKEFSKSDISLLYNYIPSTFSTNYTLPSSLTNGSVDGIIVFNIYDEHLLKLINQLDIPKVFLDTVPELPCNKLSGDVIFLEGTNNVQTLTNHLIKQGHKNIGFIGDIYYAQTNADRYTGYVKAMNENNLQINPEFCFTKKIDINAYEKKISHFLDSLTYMPTAFVCVSDYVAYFLYNHLTEKGYRFPEDIAITGYDGSIEYSSIADIITTVDVNTKALGQRLAHQILFRIENTQSPHEVTYIYPEIIYRSSSIKKQ